MDHLTTNAAGPSSVDGCVDSVVEVGDGQGLLAAVGLDVGGRSPAEIAVSIMGDLLAVRYDRKGGHSTRQTPAVVEEAE